MSLTITVPVILVLAASAIMVTAARIENRRDDRAAGKTPGRRPLPARVARAARHAYGTACRLPGADTIDQLRAQLIAAGAFKTPAADPWARQPAAGEKVPGRDSPAASPDAKGESAPAPVKAGAAHPAGDLTPAEAAAIASSGALVTHPDPSMWEGHRNIAPWFDPDSPWADEPGSFTASIARGEEEVA